MLKELLIEIKNADYISKSRMANKLNQPLELIEDAFNQLSRMGYIEEDDDTIDCDSFCGNCPYSNNCNKTAIKTIKITPKGEKLLAK